MSKILDGKVVRDTIARKIELELKKLKVSPKLVIIQIGNDQRSSVYVKQKKIFGERLGFEVEYIQLDKKVSENELISKIESLNTNIFVHGIIVQLPLPKHLNESKIKEVISLEKDVDGMNSGNIKLLLEGNKEGFVPATTKGIISLLDFYKIKIESKKVVVVGRSMLVGKPIALAFINRNATVTICHSKTKNLKEEIKNADIVVVAVGKPLFIKKSFTNKKQVIIDVGITKVKDMLVGDVDYKAIHKEVLAITPVPGGVGPMTVVSLFENVLTAFKRQSRR